MTGLLGGLAGTAATLVLVVIAVLGRQIAVINQVVPLAETPPPRSAGRYGRRLPGRALTLVVLGDSFAAGYGTGRSRETPGALLSTALARRLGRPVDLHPLAVVGAMSADLCHQVDAALPKRPDAAVIYIGGNDVTQLAVPGRAVRHLGEAVRRLRRTGCEVIVGTCPNLRAVPPLKPPLRWLAQAWSRRLAAGQTTAVRRAGGRAVSLADLLNPAFEAEADRMFGADRFHPSADGYALAAAVTLPTLVAALGASAAVRAPAAVVVSPPVVVTAAADALAGRDRPKGGPGIGLGSGGDVDAFDDRPAAPTSPPPPAATVAPPTAMSSTAG